MSFTLKGKLVDVTNNSNQPLSAYTIKALTKNILSMLLEMSL